MYVLNWDWVSKVHEERRLEELVCFSTTEWRHQGLEEIKFEKVLGCSGFVDVEHSTS